MPRHRRPDGRRGSESGGGSRRAGGSDHAGRSAPARGSGHARGSGPAGRADQAGQGIVEYGLILSLSTLLAVILLAFFGPTMSFVLKAVGDAIDAAS